MTRERAKELLPIIQAYAESKNIQFRRNVNDEWEDIKEPSFNILNEYRIKPESKYRSFKNQEECWDEMMKHQPFGWVKHKVTEDCCNILNIYKTAGTTKILLDTCSYTFPSLFDEFVFIDGTPFGIKEE